MASGNSRSDKGNVIDAVTEALNHFQKLEDEDQAMADAIEEECIVIEGDKDREIAAMREFVDAMDPDEAAQKLAEYMSCDQVTMGSNSYAVIPCALAEWGRKAFRVAIDAAAKSAIARRIELSKQDEARAAQMEDWE